MRKSRKILLYLGIALAVLAVLLAAAYGVALHVLKQQITDALGKGGEVSEINVSLSSVDITGLRIKALRDGKMMWPAEDELRAAHIRVEPDLRSLLSGNIVVRSITVEDAVLPILRNRAGMQILPGLRSQQAGAGSNKPAGTETAKKSGPTIRIGSIRLVNSRIDFYDATIRQKPLHIPLQDIALSLDNVVLPALDEKSRLHMSARVANQGSLKLDGWLVPSNMDSDLTLKLANVPMTLLEPYLFKGASGQVKGGALALDLSSRVNKRQLRAPGKAVITHLELGGLTGLTRDAAAAWLRHKGQQVDTTQPVDLAFTLQGNLDDANFSLNDTIYLQAGVALTKVLGLGSLGSGDSGKSSGSGVGGFLRGLFGK